MNDRDAKEDIGPYRILKELGRGASGRVFLCQHTGLGLQHAVKVLALEGAQNPESMERFKRETIMLSTVDHPGIVKVHAAGFWNAQPYFAMDYVKGVTLRAAQKEGLPLDQVLDVIEELALALGHVHSKGLVHRDVKPANVMVCEGHARLTDFGLAKLLGVRSQRLTQTGDLLGTPAYMAHEQADPAVGEISPATDVFALGAMVYQAFEGLPPFYCDSGVDIYRRLRRREPAPALKSPEANGQIRLLCERALAINPRRRYPNGLAFYRALAEARRPSQDALPRHISTTPSNATKLAGLALLLTGLGIGVVATALLSPKSPSLPSTVETPPAASPRSEDPGPSVAEDAPEVATPVTFTSLNQVKRSRIQTLEQGFIVTALSADGDYRLATIVEDHGDEGYMLVFSDGEQKLLRQPREGFLPDVFFPGAQVSAPGQPAQGRIVRRQGQAVLVEFLADQQRWYPAALLSLAPWAKVPPPGVAARLDMTLSRWSSGTTYYPALELERQGGKLLVIYLDEGTVELREPSDLSPLPRPGSRVQFEPAEGRIEVATVVNFLNEIAVQLRFENGEELWVETTRITRK